MRDTWRLLLDDGPVDGAWNMALDRAVQLAREAGEVPPTLRLYRWKRPTVTIGRFQDVDSVDLDYCDSHGIDVVRRFTGGRGVLHDDEVTYSIVAGVADGVPRGVAASYRRLCAGLARAYQLLGVQGAGLTALSHGERGSSACYLHATGADLSVGALKLSGSAQVWQGTTVLQHGSFTISRDVGRDAHVFRLDDDSGVRLAQRTATLDELLSPVPSIDQIIGAAVRAIGDSLEVCLEIGQLLESERETAMILLPQVHRNSRRSRDGATP